MKEKTQPVCEHCGYNERTQNAPHQLPAGTILRDQYLVGRVLGQGGFGITYLGWDLYLDTPIAIKEYYPNGFVTRECTYSLNVTGATGSNAAQFVNGRERFLREAKSLARFTDVPEIVHVRNFFEANNTAYIVMEYIDGITLKQYIRTRGGRLTAEETFAIVRPVMEALSTIHKAGIIHRDISPDNIMMLPRGRAKLLDFGAARDVSDADTQRELPRSTEAILKHGFAPIEQYQRRGSLGPWTDVYALCATIFYCLTGCVPPDAPERMIGDQELRWLERAPGLSASQARALEQGMAPLPKNRIGSVDDLYNALFRGNWEPQPEPVPVPTPNPEPVSVYGTVPLSGTVPASVSIPASGNIPVSGTIPASGTIPVSNVVPNFEPMPVPNTQIKPRKDKGPILAVVAAVVLVLAAIGLIAGNVGKEPIAKDPIAKDPGNKAPLFQEQTADRSQWEANLLMSDPCEIDVAEEQETYPVFGSDIPRGEVITITCLDTLKDAPGSKWDVSQDQNGTVYAWVEDRSSGGYDLYLGAEGGINGADACEFLFMGYRNVKEIRFNGCFHSDDAADMDFMFYNCESLEKVDAGNLCTSGAETMICTFSDCKSLTKLDVSRWDTSQVTDMYALFSGCESLTELDVSGFDTSRVMDMMDMFDNCESLTKLDLSNFDTAQVTGMFGMFYGCGSLRELDLSSFDTSQVTNMSWMFYGCNSLENLDLSGFDVSKVEDYEDFMEEDALYNGRPWVEFFQGGSTTPNTYADTDRSQWENNLLMPDPCKDYMAEEQDVYPVFGSNIPRGKVISITCLDTLEDAPGSKWDISRNQNGTVYAWVDQLASGYYDLYLAAEGGINAGEACEALFMGYRFVQNIRFNGCFHTDDAVDMGRMFYCCDSLQSVDVESFRTSQVQDMGNMFSGCESLTKLDLRNFDTSQVTNMSDMFYNCEGLTALDLSSFDTSLVEDMSFMFSSCRGLTELDLSSFDTSRVENMQSMFQSCRGLVRLDLSNFYTPCLTDMGWMFNWCDSLVELDIHNFDTSLVTEMNDVFSYCEALETVDFGEFETDSVETYDCFLDAGVTIDGEPWENLFK